MKRTDCCSKTLAFSCLVFLAFSPSLFAQTIQVTSTTPNTAALGTINLNVTVGGSGFKKGAQAAWLVSGTTNPGGVTVNSTSFNSSSQLTANITVSSTATTGSFDVVVTNTDGRSGKGTQLFSVSNGPSSTCGGYNVTSIVADTDSSNLPFQFQSDGKGSYVTYTNSKTDSVISQIQQSSCAWLFDTTNSTSRGVTLTLLYPASTPSAPAPFTTATVLSRIITTCNANALNNGISVGSMTFTGQTLDCALRFGAIPYNGNTYAVAFSPNNFTGTTWARVTCTGAVSSLCNSWTVTAPPLTTDPSTGQASAIGELLQVSTVKGKTVTTLLGLYYVAFSVTITK